MLVDIYSHNGSLLFKASELACKGSGGGRLAKGFADKLRELRQNLGKPMKVFSCCRSQAYNTKVGGKPKSFHIYDHNPWGIEGSSAIDIATPTGDYRKHLIELALQKGWTVGVYKTFVHLDRRSDYINTSQILFVG
jgi:hypothetical protein